MTSIGSYVWYKYFFSGQEILDIKDKNEAVYEVI